MGQERFTSYYSKKKSNRALPFTSSLIACCSVLMVFFLLAVSAPAFAIEISSINTRLVNNELFASASVKPDAKFMEDMNEGLSKEFILYIDLFRVWSVWPDEFVTGKKLVRVLKSDPIKREYVATNLEGNLLLEKRFKDAESMVAWAMNISEIKLANVREFEPGTYFVKVTVESHVRKLPPVIGHIIFFVKEKDSISKNSDQFQVTHK